MQGSPGSGVYVIRNLVTQKEYVGSAVCLSRRRRVHLCLLRRGAHHSVKLQRSWDKHGESAFTFEVLAHVAEKTLLLKREQEWLDALGSAEYGYNVLFVAGSRIGRTRSPATRAKISAGLKGRTVPAEVRAKISATGKGRKRSTQHQSKLSAALTGKQRSASQRARMSAAHKNVPLSLEHKDAIARGMRVLRAKQKQNTQPAA